MRYFKCDDDFEDVDYVSFKEVNGVEQEEKEFDLEDILQIQDIILHERLLKISRLITNIESLKDNPTPDCVLNSPSSFLIPVMDSDAFFEESDTSLSHLDNSLPEFETFSDHTKETRSGSTTTHANYSLPEYDSFLFEIEPDQEGLISIDNSNNNLYGAPDYPDFEDSRAHGYSIKQLKSLSFEEVKEIFETTMRRVHSFVPMDSELEVQRLKRAGQEVLEEPAKRQKIGEASGSGCYLCGDPLDDILCRRYSCGWCGNKLNDGFCSYCASKAGNSFAYDPNLNSFDNSPNYSDYSPQPANGTGTDWIKKNASMRSSDDGYISLRIKDSGSTFIDTHTLRLMKLLITECKELQGQQDESVVYTFKDEEDVYRSNEFMFAIQN
ncbi:reverse transcriptase domain-containing protein [Tanacetum coccineum]